MLKPIVYDIESVEIDTPIEINNLTETLIETEFIPMELQTKTVTPQAYNKIEISPDAPYGGLGKVIINEIPYSEVSNAFGMTCIIGG